MVTETNIGQRVQFKGYDIPYKLKALTNGGAAIIEMRTYPGLEPYVETVAAEDLTPVSQPLAETTFADLPLFQEDPHAA